MRADPAGVISRVLVCRPSCEKKPRQGRPGFMRATTQTNSDAPQFTSNISVAVAESAFSAAAT
eukprot:6823432-Prymnesium_polylepis.1